MVIYSRKLQLKYFRVEKLYSYEAIKNEYFGDTF